MTYLLRDVDDKTWERFKRACGELSIRDVLVALILAYARGDVVIAVKQVRYPSDRYPRRSE